MLKVGGVSLAIENLEKRELRQLVSRTLLCRCKNGQ